MTVLTNLDQRLFYCSTWGGITGGIETEGVMKRRVAWLVGITLLIALVAACYFWRGSVEAGLRSSVDTLAGRAGGQSTDRAAGLAASGSYADAAGLAALSAAQTARTALLLAWFQFVVGMAGMIALLLSLREGRRATATALAAIQTERQVQRAHLTIETIGLKGEGIDRRLELGIKNTGLTPALLQQGSFHLLQAKALPAEPSYSARGNVQGTGLVSAGERWQQALPSLKDESITPDLETPIWMYGMIDYKDVFGERHDLRFCYRFSPNGEVNTAGTAGTWWRST